MRSPLTATAAAFAVILLALAGCGSQGGSPTAARAAAPPPSSGTSGSSHVVVLVLENHEANQVLGSRKAPYFNSLARRYALATNYYGISHPSLPNYLALIGGSTFGRTSDCTDCGGIAAPTVASQLEAKGLTWRAYMEGMPRPCFSGDSSGNYAKKHNPFVYFTSANCGNDVPASQLNPRKLPAFSFIAPDICHDAHDCSLGTADTYLRKLVPKLLSGLGPSGFLVLTWDEGESDARCCGGLARGGKVATVVAGPTVRRGARVATPLTHYSTLRTIEQAFGLPLLGNAAAPQTQPLDQLFRTPPRLARR